VRRVGGLADTVADTRLETLDTDATGFVFDDFSADALLAATHRAQALYRRQPDWRHVQQRAMQQPFGWAEAAQQYLKLYERVAP
jgi:starch synthase